MDSNTRGAHNNGSAGALLLLNAEGESGVAPPPLPFPLRAPYRIDISSKNTEWTPLAYTSSCCTDNRAADALLLAINTSVKPNKR